MMMHFLGDASSVLMLLIAMLLFLLELGPGKILALLMAQSTERRLWVLFLSTHLCCIVRLH